VYEFQLPEHMVREWVHNLNEWAKNNCVVTRNKTLPMLPNSLLGGCDLSNSAPCAGQDVSFSA